MVYKSLYLLKLKTVLVTKCLADRTNARTEQTPGQLAVTVNVKTLYVPDTVPVSVPVIVKCQYHICP